MRSSRAALTIAAWLAAFAGVVALQAVSAAAASGSAVVASAKLAAADSSSCQADAVAELDAVVRRIYDQAVNGILAKASVRRLEHSRPLAVAVARGNRAAIRAALPSLVKHQVVRIEILGRGDRVLFSAGRPVPAFAPKRFAVRDAHAQIVGHVILTVTDDRAFIGLVQRLTAAEVVMASGSRTISSTPGFTPPGSLSGVAVDDRGASFHAYSIAAQAFPSGRLTISILVGPQPESLCGTDALATHLRTIGYVGERLYRAERSSRAVRYTLRYAAHNAAFRRAVALRRPEAIRAAIVGFFRNHRYHIVRVRVITPGHKPVDVGGPYVLAPAVGSVHGPTHRPAGRFMLAVQDDTGYIKLMRRFTGVAVQLQIHGVTVPGSTLQPGPRHLPAFGAVRYLGRRYLGFAFTAIAFPANPLRIGLLTPS